MSFFQFHHPSRARPEPSVRAAAEVAALRASGRTGLDGHSGENDRVRVVTPHDFVTACDGIVRHLSAFIRIGSQWSFTFRSTMFTISNSIG